MGRNGRGGTAVATVLVLAAAVVAAPMQEVVGWSFLGLTAHTVAVGDLMDPEQRGSLRVTELMVQGRAVLPGEVGDASGERLMFRVGATGGGPAVMLLDGGDRPLKPWDRVTLGGFVGTYRVSASSDGTQLLAFTGTANRFVHVDGGAKAVRTVGTPQNTDGLVPVESLRARDETLSAGFLLLEAESLEATLAASGPTGLLDVAGKTITVPPGATLAASGFAGNVSLDAGPANVTVMFLEGYLLGVRIVLRIGDPVNEDVDVTVGVQQANARPIADFRWLPTDPVTFEEVHFEDLSTDDGAVLARHWDFEDGNFSILANPHHTYERPGTYRVVLAVTDNLGETSHAMKDVVIGNRAPTVRFGWTPPQPYSADILNFTDTSFDPDGRLSAWAWDFGEGNASADQNPQHAFPEPGAYDVTLTVSDDSGASRSATERLLIGDRPPTADFTFAPADPYATQVVQFTDASTDVDGTVVHWLWEFGDGTTALGPTPQHAFPDDGAYVVRLRVTDDAGGLGIATRTLDVRNLAPLVAFELDPAVATEGSPVTFRSTSIDVDGEVTAWSWDFGDGGTATGNVTQHTFATGGPALVTLVATDDDGGSASLQRSIIVNDAPTAGFAFAPLAPTIVDTVHFDDRSSDVDGAILGWAWSFGDGNTSTVASPTHAYERRATYEVRLVVTDDQGGTDEERRILTVVNAAPIADFAFGPGTPSVGRPTTFTDASTDADGTITNRLWDFGDGSTSTLEDPVKTYELPGVYSVTLRVQDNDGAVAQADRTVEVKQGPNVDFSWSPLEPGRGQAVLFQGIAEDLDGSIASVSWSMSDGFGSTLRNVTHAFAAIGTYDVTFTATDDEGLASNITKQVSVERKAPTAGFTFSPSSPSMGDTVAFTDASTDPDTPIVSRSWSFGDAATSTVTNPSHVYAADGLYLVRLTVTDSEGLSSATEQLVRVVNRSPLTVSADVDYLNGAPVDLTRSIVSVTARNMNTGLALTKASPNMSVTTGGGVLAFFGPGEWASGDLVRVDVTLSGITSNAGATVPRGETSVSLDITATLPMRTTIVMNAPDPAGLGPTHGSLTNQLNATVTVTWLDGVAIPGALVAGSSGLADLPPNDLFTKSTSVFATDAAGSVLLPVPHDVLLTVQSVGTEDLYLPGRHTLALDATLDLGGGTVIGADRTTTGFLVLPVPFPASP